jgi:hypothetical protein
LLVHIRFFLLVAVDSAAAAQCEPRAAGGIA